MVCHRKSSPVSVRRVRTACLILFWLLLAPMIGAAEEIPRLQNRVHRVRFCGFGGDRATIEHLQRWWPNIEYCRAYDPNNVAGMRELAINARMLGVTFALQATAPVFPPGYLDLHDCWAVDFLNRKPPELGSIHPVADYCHPATVAALRDNVDVAIRQVGASSLSMVDFVWPWYGGAWGFSPACLDAYRAVLAETDVGLRLSSVSANPSDLSNKTIHFWDYFEELSGLRLKPSDLGYEKWQQYEPFRANWRGDLTDAEKRNVFVFRGLIHYCWLQYAQTAAIHAKSLGGELQASINPENCGNGTDLLTWSRLADTGEPWWEQWGSPWTAIAGYHTYRYFAEPHRSGQKRLGLIGETGAAGGHPFDVGFGPARPHYWDPNSNYAITWALSAAGQFDDREEDYIYTSPEETEDPAGQHADCWRGYVKGMDGFWQYTLDAPQRQVAKVLSIVNRSLLHETDSSEQSVHQKYSLAPPLVDMHVDFEQAYFPLSNSMLEGRQILLFAPWEYPAEILPRLSRWLAKDSSRIIVTHSFVPTRPCKGLALDVLPEMDDPVAAEALGLFGLHKTDVTRGKLTSIDPSWREGFGIPIGTELTFERPLTACDQGTPLVKLGDVSLVTKVNGRDGGTVIYLHFTPPERYENSTSDSARLLRAVMDQLMRQNSVRPQAEGSAAWACARYDLDGGHAYFLLDRRQARQTRFTEETPLYDQVERLSLCLKPLSEYWIYDLLTQSIGKRKTDDQGRLEIFLSGRSVRLIHVHPVTSEPTLIFTTAGRRDGRRRTELPATIFAHRSGTVSVAGIPEGAVVSVDGHPVTTSDPTTRDRQALLIGPGEHKIEVKKPEHVR